MNRFMATCAQHYSQEKVWALLTRVFSKTGLGLASTVLQLYYLARSPQVPLWAKTAIFTALGYFVMTPDAIPDVTPVVGFADDLAVMTSALAAVAGFMTPEVRAQVGERLRIWFGDAAADAAFAEVEKPDVASGEGEDSAARVL